jgi:hypothetical protein
VPPDLYDCCDIVSESDPDDGKTGREQWIKGSILRRFVLDRSVETGDRVEHMHLKEPSKCGEVAYSEMPRTDPCGIPVFTWLGHLHGPP